MAKSRQSTWKERVRRTFIAGIFAFVPLAVTAFIIYWINDKAQGLTDLLWHKRIPFVGVAIALAAVYLTGMVTTSVVGRYVLQLVDWLLGRVPIIRLIYRAWKQIALTPGGTEGMFAKVVLVPDETNRMQMLAFSNGKLIEGEEPMYCAFVPSTPNPVMGRLYFVAADKCRFLDMSTEEAFKIILSIGNYIPPLIPSTAKEKMTGGSDSA